jgi:hypothetical protein
MPAEASVVNNPAHTPDHIPARRQRRGFLLCGPYGGNKDAGPAAGEQAPIRVKVARPAGIRHSTFPGMMKIKVQACQIC